jgi:hypothetical protein
MFVSLGGSVLFKMDIDEVVRSKSSQWVVSFGIVKGRDKFPYIGIQVIRPPLQHQPALPQMLRLMDVSRPYRVTFLVTHLPLYRIPRPQA